MAGNQTTIPALRKARAKQVTQEGPVRKAPTALEQSEAQRQRALGAQNVLREELTAANLRADKLGLAEYEARAGKEAETARRLVAERDTKVARESLDIATAEANRWSAEATRLRGMLEMLERLGTIPKQEPDQMGYLPNGFHPQSGTWR